VGGSLFAEMGEYLNGLRDAGWHSRQIARLVETVADTRKALEDPESLFDLVLSGPAVEGVPTRDTSAVMHQLIEDAEEEVILVGYAFYRGKKLFERLAQRMASDNLSVWFCLNIDRKWKDTTRSPDIVRRFVSDFAKDNWPWDPKPEMYYDPRALEEGGGKKASLHAKCLIVDRKVAMITSANFTEAAQERNIEVGIIVQHVPLVRRLADYFEGLRETLLQRCRIPGTADV